MFSSLRRGCSCERLSLSEEEEVEEGEAEEEVDMKRRDWRWLMDETDEIWLDLARESGCRPVFA